MGARTAGGEYSTAMGTNVGAGNFGSFIIGDGDFNSALTATNKDNEFKSVFGGGYTLYSARNLSSGVYMNGATSGWTNISDRNKKENFCAIDGEQLLSKIRSMQITRWNYRNTDPSIQYIGPVAQDFYAAFHLGGKDSLGINSICIDGVNMAAVQALEKRTAELKEKIAELELVKSELVDLKERLFRLEKALSMPKEFTQHVTNDPGSQR